MFKRLTGARALVLGVGGFVGVLSGVLTYLQLAEQIVPQVWARYLPIGMIAGFAAAIWALGTAEKNPREDYRASVRIEGGLNDKHLRLGFEMHNIGDLEAQHISIEPVSDGFFPWYADIREIGSLAKVQNSVEFEPRIVDRADLKCDTCSGKPRDIQEFIVNLLLHHAHAVPDDLSTVDVRDAEYAIRAAAKMWDLALPMVAHYRDEMGRKMVAKHQVHLTPMRQKSGRALQ